MLNDNYVSLIIGEENNELNKIISIIIIRPTHYEEAKILRIKVQQLEKSINQTIQIRK